MQRFTIPAKFADDHFDRCCFEQDEGGLAVLVKSGPRQWVVDLNDEALSNLRSDAEYYADPYGPDECPPGLKASAKRTVEALGRQGL